MGLRGAARRHLADARLVVVEDFRNRGLGTALLGELCDIAREGGLKGVLMEAVEDKQADALAAADWLEFCPTGLDLRRRDRRRRPATRPRVTGAADRQVATIA